MSGDTKEKAAMATGAAIGGGTALAAVSTTGAVTGLGATGITSGLAAVGSVVGGGMAAGLVVTAALPIAGGALAYAGYRYLTSGSEGDDSPTTEE